MIGAAVLAGCNYWGSDTDSNSFVQSGQSESFYIGGLGYFVNGSSSDCGDLGAFSGADALSAGAKNTFAYWTLEGNLVSPLTALGYGPYVWGYTALPE
jgi:hypothetical protein